MDVELTLDAFRERRLSNAVHVARDGQSALDYLFGRAEYADRTRFPLPNPILLDLKMPLVDGITVLKTIKNTPTLRRIPVIMLTSSREEAERESSCDHGVNSYLVKPVTLDGFLEVFSSIENCWLTLHVPPPHPN